MIVVESQGEQRTSFGLLMTFISQFVAFAILATVPYLLLCRIDNIIAATFGLSLLIAFVNTFARIEEVLRK